MHRIFATAITLTTVTHPVLAIVTSDTPGSHVVTPGQTAFGVNFDGVVMIGGLFSPNEPASACTGALISDRHVLCAAHCFDFDRNGQPDSLFAPLPDAVVFQLASGFVAVEYDYRAVQFPDSCPSRKPTWPLLPCCKTRRQKCLAIVCMVARTSWAALPC